MMTPLAPVDPLEDRKRPVVLLAATLWWPLSARLAIRFLEYGCRVVAICPAGHYLRYVEGIETCFPYRGVSSLTSLERAIRKTVPDIVIPCDDRVVWQLHELYRLRPDMRELLEASLGAATEFEIVSRRDLLLQIAQTLGISIPATKLVTSEEEIHQWFAAGETAAAVKMDGTCGGEGVVIARSEEQAKDAFRKFSRQIGFLTACKRLLINGDPVSLWTWGKQAQTTISIQQLIEGRPANSMLACWKGEVLSMVSVEVLASQGATGAAFLVRITENDEMNKAARLLARRLQLSGFCGLDFLIDQRTGLPYLIEMNPRCTQLGHLPLAGGNDLAGALCEKLIGRACTTSTPSVERQVVAFFPQAERWGGRKPQSYGIYVDVPHGQTELVRELLRPSWPERQWISHIYRLFHPTRTVDSVEYSLEGSP
jgi:hypothetical protein